jgi:hypothetical protein
MASFAKIGLNGKVIAVHSVVNEVLHDSKWNCRTRIYRYRFLN